MNNSDQKYQLSRKVTLYKNNLQQLKTAVDILRIVILRKARVICKAGRGQQQLVLETVRSELHFKAPVISDQHKIRKTNYNVKGKVKAIPLQVWTGPEGFRRLRLPDFKAIGT